VTLSPTESDSEEGGGEGGGGDDIACPANEPYLGLDVVIEISYRQVGNSEEFTVEEILAAPFSKEMYRTIYRTDYLNVGPFNDLTCTSDMLFEPRTPPETGTFGLKWAIVLNYVFLRSALFFFSFNSSSFCGAYTAQ
jgi:hypothetical protein